MTSGLGAGDARSAATLQPRRAAKGRTRIVMGGYSAPTTGFSQALKAIGDRLEARFGDQVEVRYVYNILDLGYRGDDILWLVESGVLTLGYQSSSYLTDRVPELGAVDLPFIFPDVAAARAAMDGPLGRLLAQRIEAVTNFRIAGFFENGFRHVSNRRRPVTLPADLQGMTIRVLPSRVQARTFELLGAIPRIMDLSEAIAAVKDGQLDAQENPFSNTVNYGVHKYHRFHTATNHFYVSRPIFVHRPSFDAWPRAIREEFADAVRDAITFQRGSHLEEERDAMLEIQRAGGTILDLSAAQHAAFAAAVRPIHGEARRQYRRDLLDLIDL